MWTIALFSHLRSYFSGILDLLKIGQAISNFNQLSYFQFKKERGHSRPLFLYFRLFSTVDSKCNFLAKTGFEPRTSGYEATTLPTEPQPLPNLSCASVIAYVLYSSYFQLLNQTDSICKHVCLVLFLPWFQVKKKSSIIKLHKVTHSICLR